MARPNARSRGYNHQWDEASSGYRRHNPLCVACLAAGRVVAAELVDHIVPHKGNPSLFWDRTNWQSLCHWHHNVVKQYLEPLYDKGAIQATQLDLSTSESVTLMDNLGIKPFATGADGWPIR